MAVNLSKNRLELLTAYQDVIDEKSSTDWALYTYEDNSNDLTLASSGGGGLPEITVCFDNSRVMYGFCSLKDPISILPRYILINWVGEDVPDARKCACASHVAMIAEFFQGVDVIINASSMEDIDPAAIGQRLTNGTARVASPVLSRLKMKDEEATEPVGTCYQKTNAEIEMKKLNREEFWEQAKREEELRKEEERRKAQEERQRFEEERMELERKEQEEREKRYREREKQIEEHRKKLLTQEAEEAKERSSHQSIFVEDEDELKEKKMESEVEEAAAIIAQRTENPREYFKQREKAVACSFDSSPASVQRTGRLDSPFLKLQHSLPEPSSSPPRSPLLSPTLPHCRQQSSSSGNSNTSPHRSPVSPSTPIPRIITTPISEEAEDDNIPESHTDWDQEPCFSPSAEEVVPSKPVHSVAPLMQDQFPANEDTSFMEFEEQSHVPEPLPPSQDTGNLLDLWENAPQSSTEQQQQQQPMLVDLLDDSQQSSAFFTDVAPPPSMDMTSSVDGASSCPDPSGLSLAEGTLLSFDDLPDPPSTFCKGDIDEDNPPSLVDIEGSHEMTLSYQRALQEASDSQDDGHLLMTNGETLQKESTQASEGYFSQSQEEEFIQPEESSAKVIPAPIFYNKPPEIDITCWDNDPVADDDEYGAAE
ncbi:drebrin isoform X2 [Erpetoichthys calabaricus]|uniref:drebrin isoform X2 n=1 Tax=Erpetoichthys calabaricus TaxID=27687 RepID=UPI0022341716|nr:drebrin isoform X2 [Erpetoichthys calabaricus]